MYIELIQHTTDFGSDRTLAAESIPGIKGQDGVLAVRLLAPKWGMRGWTIAYYTADYVCDGQEGTRRVSVTDTMLSAWQKDSGI